MHLARVHWWFSIVFDECSLISSAYFFILRPSGMFEFSRFSIMNWQKIFKRILSQYIENFWKIHEGFRFGSKHVSPFKFLSNDHGQIAEFLYFRGTLCVFNEGWQTFSAWFCCNTFWLHSIARSDYNFPPSKTDLWKWKVCTRIWVQVEYCEY